MSKRKNRPTIPQKPEQNPVRIPAANGNGNAVAMTQTVTAFQGPIPPPNVLAGYNEVVPNLAERIVTMAEAEQRHRITESAKVNDANIRVAATAQKLQLLGMAGAFILALSFLGAAVFLGMNGQPWLGGLIATATLGVLAGAFAVDRWKSPPGNEKK